MLVFDNLRTAIYVPKSERKAKPVRQKNIFKSYPKSVKVGCKAVPCFEYVTCEYCGNEYNIMLAVCPACYNTPVSNSVELYDHNLR